MTKEMPKIPHDALFKELLRRFLPEVMALFLPDEAAMIRWETMQFVDKELALNLPEALRRIADIVVEVERKDGQPETILLHVEVEASRKGTLPQRMFEYYALLRLLKNQLVLPVVMMLLPVGDSEIRLQRYQERIGKRAYMTLDYWQVNLRDLAGDEYAKRLEPVAAALSAVMPLADPVTARLRSWRTIVNNQQLTAEEKSFLMLLTDIYLPLKTLEPYVGEDLMSELVMMKEPYLFDPYEIGLREGLEQGREQGLEQGREQGLEQGLEEGVIEGMRASVRRLLVGKFGALSLDWEERLKGIDELAMLERLLVGVLEVEAIEELPWGEE